MERRLSRQENVPKLVRFGEDDEGAGRGVARAHDASVPNDRREHGGNIGQLDSRPYDRFHGGPQQAVLSREA